MRSSMCTCVAVCRYACMHAISPTLCCARGWRLCRRLVTWIETASWLIHLYLLYYLSSAFHLVRFRFVLAAFGPHVHMYLAD